MKRLLFKIKDCWTILGSDQYAVVSRKGENVALSRQMNDKDAVRYFTAFSNVIMGGKSAVDLANKQLKS